MAHYIVTVSPAATKVAANRLIALIEGENPATSQNLSQPASTTIVNGWGQAPWTHWYGGRPADDARLAKYQGTFANLPSAVLDALPLMDGQTVLLSVVDAAAAWAALYVNVNTGENAETLPALNLSTVLSALSLGKPEPQAP